MKNGHFWSFGTDHCMSGHVTSRNITSCHVTSRRVMSCASQHGTSRNVTSFASRHFVSRHIVSRHVCPWHVTEHQVASRHVVSCHVTSRRVTSRHVTSRHVMSCHVISVAWHVRTRHVSRNVCRMARRVTSCRVVSLGTSRHVLTRLVTYHVMSHAQLLGVDVLEVVPPCRGPHLESRHSQNELVQVKRRDF